MDGRRIYTANANSDLKPYLGSTTGIWSALDATDGHIIWQTRPTRGGGTSGPVTAANGVVVGCSLDPLGHMYALNAATGQELWSFARGAIVRKQQVLDLRVPTLRDDPVFGVVSPCSPSCVGAFGGKRCWDKVFDRREPVLARGGGVYAFRFTRAHIATVSATRLRAASTLGHGAVHRHHRRSRTGLLGW